MSVFTDAIRVLEERGWHQGGYGPGIHHGAGSVCVLGAIALANGFNLLDHDRPLFLHHDNEGCFLRDLLGVVDVAVWNDDPHTTYEDIVLCLKRAHELAEAE